MHVRATIVMLMCSLLTLLRKEIWGTIMQSSVKASGLCSEAVQNVTEIFKKKKEKNTECHCDFVL